MKRITRRIFLKVSAAAAALLATGFPRKLSLKQMVGEAGAESIPQKTKTLKIKFLERSFFQRLLGTPATSLPRNSDCWTYAGGQLSIDLAKAPELKIIGGALRFEGKNLPERVLVVYGDDKTYRAYKNRCTHIGHRRLDPVPGTDTVQCCSVNKSTYDLDGKKIYGPAPKPIITYPAALEGDRLDVTIP